MLTKNTVFIVVNRGKGKRGEPAFRESFAKLGELRSIVKQGE